MLLRDYLGTKYKKEELLVYARIFEIRNYSGLRKQELINRIVECFGAEEKIRHRMACCTKEQVALFQKAESAPVSVSQDEVVNAICLCKYWLGYFEDETNQFCVFEDVAESFHSIADAAWKKEQTKKEWLVQCLKFFHCYYGIVPVEVLYQLYSQREQDSIEDMIAILEEIPVDIREAYLYSMNQLGMKDWPEKNPLYSERGLLLDTEYFDEQKLDQLLKRQEEKTFYIPTSDQIEQINKAGYETDIPENRLLKDFLKDRLSMSEEDENFWCYEIWMNFCEGESPSDVMNEMAEEKVVFENEDMMQEFMDLLIQAQNHTRRKENRGHQLCEIQGRTLYDLQDVQGTIVKAGKKVYPNDPCPCGSGKKYKKCCGRGI